MTKLEFKIRWESDDVEDNITFDDIAICAKEWGLFSKPKTAPMDYVTYKVLLEAGCKNADSYYHPAVENDKPVCLHCGKEFNRTDFVVCSDCLTKHLTLILFRKDGSRI